MKAGLGVIPLLALAIRLAVTTSAFAGQTPTAPALRNSWTSTTDGLEIAVRSAGSAVVVLVRVDPARAALRVVRASDGASMTAADAARLVGAAAAINGGFFDAHGKPIGWLTCDGREIIPPGRAGWGAFVVRDGRAAMVGPRPSTTTGVSQAVQAGPRLVVAGKPNPRLKVQSARRSFIGLDAQGRVILGTTGPSVVDAREFAAFLAKPEADGGAGLVEALNLDGGSSSQLHVRGAPDGDIDFPGIPVPTFIAIMPPAKAP